MTTEIVKKSDDGAAVAPLRPTEVTQQVRLIQEVMTAVMHKDEHYGIVPGTSGKPSLYKAGAEKLSMTFRLAPTFEIRQVDFPGEHREYQIVCKLNHIVTGAFWGSGVGCCSTMESKYRFRHAANRCPKCGKETIIKGKAEYGGGYICFQKKGGCGAKFSESDPAIVDQPKGKVENENLADQYNTVLKMAKKRAHVDAVLTATAASDCFTQDLEDLMENGVIDITKQSSPPPKKQETPANRKPPETSTNAKTKAPTPSVEDAPSSGERTDYARRLTVAADLGAIEDIASEIEVDAEMGAAKKKALLQLAVARSKKIEANATTEE